MSNLVGVSFDESAYSGPRLAAENLAMEPYTAGLDFAQSSRFAIAATVPVHGRRNSADSAHLIFEGQ